MSLRAPGFFLPQMQQASLPGSCWSWMAAFLPAESISERRPEPCKIWYPGARIALMQSVVLKLHPDDNVLIALRDLREGEKVAFAERTFVLTSDVPAKHKFVTDDLFPGADVLMYGVVVGKATQAIQK